MRVNGVRRARDSARDHVVLLAEPDGHQSPLDQRPTALRDMHRVLRPGGRLLIVDFRPSRNRIDHLIGALAGHAMQHNPSANSPTSSLTPATTSPTPVPVALAVLRSSPTARQPHANYPSGIPAASCPGSRI